MPVTVSISGEDRVHRRVSAITGRYNNPDLTKFLGQKMSEEIVSAFYESGLHDESGATVLAFSYVGEPTRWANQYGRGWRVTVGDPAALGKESDSAPRGTLRAFFDYLIENNIDPDVSFTRWINISPENKILLQQGRREGLFGGGGPNYAYYAWVQNAGNAAADITARGFIEKGKRNFQAKVAGYLDDWKATRA